MLQVDQRPLPRLPELKIDTVVQILKNCFAVFCDPVLGRPYYVRFKSLTDPTRAVQGMTHAQTQTISPLFLRQILERFDIKQADFIEALSESRKIPLSAIAVMGKEKNLNEG